MVIGIDFDNTIICYDDIFWQTAVEDNLIDPSVPRNKTAIRDDLRRRQLEKKWIELQGIVYGDKITGAVMFKGLDIFLDACTDIDATLMIISHKTRYPNSGHRIDLRNAATTWLSTNGFFHRWLSPTNVYFESTLSEKVARISREKCDVFIDDLEDVFMHPFFPAETRQILFNSMFPAQTPSKASEAANWSRVYELLFREP